MQHKLVPNVGHHKWEKNWNKISKTFLETVIDAG